MHGRVIYVRCMYQHLQRGLQWKPQPTTKGPPARTTVEGPGKLFHAWMKFSFVSFPLRGGSAAFEPTGGVWLHGLVWSEEADGLVGVMAESERDANDDQHTSWVFFFGECVILLYFPKFFLCGHRPRPGTHPNHRTETEVGQGFFRLYSLAACPELQVRSEP